MTEQLPKFNKPPLTETVLGVEFDSLSEFKVPHFGLFLDEIKDKYKSFTELPPIPSQIEIFEGDSIPIASLQIGYRPEIRCLFLDSKQEWRLQLQDNRFLSNWARSASEYPSYSATQRRFESNWHKFLSFLAKNNISKPKVKQCEVTYVNHIEAKPDFVNLSDIFPCLSQNVEKENFLPSPEAVAMNAVYRIPDKLGRLHISMQPVFRQAEAKEVLQLLLTARVIPKSSEKKDISEALNIGHEWVVRGFADFTSEKMHKIWERR